MIFTDERRRRGAVLVTPAIQMTAAASGSNGITVADDDDIDFGTGDFFLHWEGSLPDWTPDNNGVALYRKSSTTSVPGISLDVDDAPRGHLLIRLFSGGGTTTFSANSSAAIASQDGAIAKITVAVVRESASAAGSVTFYVNGTQLGSAVSITAGTPFSISNALAVYVSGTSAARTASNTISCIVGNFAPTASEVLDLCTNGIPASWKWGSQANMVTNGDFPTNTAGWTSTASASPAVVSGECQVTTSGVGGQGIWQTVSFVAGKKYRISGDIRLVSGTGTASIRATNDVLTAQSQSSEVGSGTATRVSFEFVAGIADRIYLRGSAPGSVYGFDNITCVQTGATFAALPETIPTSGALEWPDSSGNTGGGTLPAAGATKVTIRR